MKDKKGKNTKKGKQTKQQKEPSTPISSCLSFGKLDLTYRIEFNEKDLEKTEEDMKKDENGSKYYNIEDIKSIKDLSFLKDKKNIWDKIILKPNNPTLEQLLIGSKLTKKKINIEYIGYGCPKFEDDEKYFDEIYKYVNEKHHLCINEKALVENNSYSLKFELIYKNKTYSFGGSDDEEKKNEEENKEENKEEKKEEENKEDNKEEKKEEEGKAGDNEEKKNKEEEKPDEYEPNDAMKEEKIPKFSREDSILCNLNPKNKKYSLFYLNYDELKDIPGNFEKKDLIELIYFLRKKGAKIFINFYKPVEEEKEEEVDEGNQNQDNEILGETYDSSGKINEKERQRKEEEANDESADEKEMKYLNNIYYLTDLYFFAFKQAIEEFNKHYKFFTTDKQDKTVINKQKVIDYFINGIASGTKKEVDGDKYGFFIDDFIKYYIIHANKKKVKKSELDCQLFPRINHNNINLINGYKNIIKKNMNNYVSLFISFLISEILINGCNISNKVYIGGFLNSLEVIKRKLECERNGVNLTEKDLMKFKISEKNLEERIKELNQEDDFVLDCINKEKSELKEYIPLYDYHLINYFRSYVNQEELKKKGFINDKGFIIYDPVHRKRMKQEIMDVKLNEEEKQNKVKNNIKNIDVSLRITDKEIESSKINKDNIIDKKLPKIKYGLGTTKNKKNKNDKSPNKSPSKSHSKSPSKSPNKTTNKSTAKNQKKSQSNKNKNNDDEDVTLLKDNLQY